MSSFSRSSIVRPARKENRGRVVRASAAATARAALAAARARAQALPASPTDSEEEGDASSDEGGGSSSGEGSSSSGEDSSSGSASGSDDEAAFVRPARGGKRGLPKRVIPAPKRARARKPPVTDIHFCGVRAPCKYGCGTLLWPGEGAVCCNRGKHILGSDLNPLSDAYLALMRLRFMSQNSRYLNTQFAFAASATSPTRAQGGLGFHEVGGFLNLHGKPYVSFHDPNAGCSGVDVYAVPATFLFDGAAQDLGEGYAEQVIELRKYLFAHHPFARRLQHVIEIDAPRIDLSSMLRISARSAPTGAMELATVSSGLQGAASNLVVYFDLSRKRRGQPATPIGVKSTNAMFELLQFPLLFERGIGGFWETRKGDRLRPQSTTGSLLTMHTYNKAMVFQNPRLRYLGRLGQEWLLSQHSREVELRLKFQRKLQEKLVVQRRYRQREGGDGEGEGEGDGGEAGGGHRVQMAATVAGSNACVVDSLCGCARAFHPCLTPAPPAPPPHTHTLP